MKKIKLNKSDFDFLKKYMELAYNSVNKNESIDNDIVFEVSDYADFLIMMNFDIVNDGMDNQNTVNEIGKQMYQIYDKILAQK